MPTDKSLDMVRLLINIFSHMLFSARISAGSFVLFIVITIFIAFLPSFAYAEGQYSVQVGRLADKARVNKLVSRLRTAGFSCEQQKIDGQFRVLCGRFDHKSQGETYFNRLVSNGYIDAFFVSVPGKGASDAEGGVQRVVPANTTILPLHSNSVTIVSKPEDNVSGNVNLNIQENYSIQVGRLADKARVNKLVSRLRTSGFQCDAFQKDGQYRVLCGDYPMRALGGTALNKLRSIGYVDAFFVRLPRKEMPYYTRGEQFVNTTVIPASNTTYRNNSLAAQGNGNMAGQGEYYAVQVGRITDKSRVVKLLSRLRSGRFTCKADKQEFDYRILCGKFAASSMGETLLAKLRSVGYADAFIAHVTPEAGNGFAFDAKPLAVAKFAPLERSGSITGDIFEREGGRFHLFGGLLMKQTDNLYYSDAAPESDMMTYINAGFWAASPALREPLADVFTANFMSGGFNRLYRTPKSKSRHLLFASAKFYRQAFSDHSYENFTGLDGSVYMGYDLPSGHRISLSDAYKSSRTFGGNTALLSGVGEYVSNQMALSARFRISGRLALRLEGGTYDIAYDRVLEQINDRKDISTKLGLEVNVSSKTTVLLEHSIKEIDYTDLARIDREEGDSSIGLYWNLSGKTDGYIKGGSYSNEFLGAGPSSSESFSYAAGAVNYRVSSKSLFRVEYSTHRKDADVMQSSNTYAISKKQALTFEWKPRAKWDVNTKIEMVSADYYQPGGANAGSDDKQKLELYVGYRVLRWLGANLLIVSIDKSSTVALADYKANEVSFGISASF